MAQYDYDIGIIGGGAAGLTVAAGSAQLGAKTLLVEKEPLLGGDCLHHGCVPSKTLIRTATAYHRAKHLSTYGLPSVELPPVEFKHVAQRIQSVISAIQVHDSEERFCGLGVKVLYGSAEFVDEHAVRVENKVLSAKNWVIATGSSPSVPDIEGLRSTPHITNMQVFSLGELPPSMIILGGGPIAMEMAQAFNRLGASVRVVQRSGQILSKEDEDMAKGVQYVLEAEGVVFHLNSQVLRVQNKGSVRTVVIKNAQGKEERLGAHTLFVALGRQVNVRGLKLENAGVDHDAKGVHVDARLRTSQKHIYAAGDVLGEHQFTHAAGYEGGIVVSNAIFHVPRKTNYTHLPWCTYTDPELASVGLNEKAAKAQGVEYVVYTEDFSQNDRALAEAQTHGKIKLLLSAKDKPLGVQILGLHGGELLGEWIAMLNGGVKLTALAGAIHPYPTLSEINKRVVGNYLGPKIFSEKIKKGLQFFFNYKGAACVLSEEDA